VFLAVLGAPADYAGRVGFARNLFAAGGIAAEVGDPADCRPDRTRIAVICSSDARYAGEGEAAAQALRAAGARHIYLAGRPVDLQSRLEAAGVHGFLHAGMDAPAFLERALDLAEPR
jgi:methylmalonyl-CoA mutase